MAQTEKGIIYPYDYNEVADVPSDFKALAESIDRILSDYSLNTESGNKIVLEMNNTTYKIKAVLKDKDDNVISTSNEIDLPLENMVTNIAYNDQKLTLTHQDGHTTEVSIADLISDLASKEEVENLQSQVKDLENLVETELESNEVEGTEIDVSDSAEYRGKVEVKGNTEQEQLSGKNLLNLQNGTYSSNGITAVVQDGKITLNGTATSTSFLTIPFVHEYDGSTYSISANNEDIIGDATGSGNYASVRISGETTSQAILGNKNATKTFTLSGTRNDFTVRTGEGLTYNNFVIYPQLEIGQPTSYEPYCGGQASPNPDYPQEIKVVTGDNVVKHVGKNLLDVSNGITNHGITTTLKEDGSIDLKGTADTTWFNMTLGTGERTKIRLLPGKYTFSVNEAVNFSLRIRAYYKNYPEEYFHITINPGETSGTFNVPRECNNFYLYAYGLTTGTVLDLNVKLQLEEGTTATSYEPYRGEEYELSLGNIELCKIGDNEDILFKNVVGDENYNAELEEGAWYKKKVINKLKVKYSEFTYIQSINPNGYVNFKFSITNNAEWTQDNNIRAESLCNFLKADQKAIANVVREGFMLTDGYSLYLRFSQDRFSTSKELEQFLEENDVYIYYIMKNAVYEKITDPTLISQLEALRKAKWFKGVNHWWTETENLEPVLKGTYKQSNNLKNKAKNDEQDERLTNLESRLALLE